MAAALEDPREGKPGRDGGVGGGVGEDGGPRAKAAQAAGGRGGQAPLKGMHTRHSKWKSKDLMAFVLDLDFESNRTTTFPSYKKYSKKLISIV